MSEEFLYRYYGYTAHGIDSDGDITGPESFHVGMLKYPVIKHTPKGVWISIYGDKRFVLLNARRKFACKTKELAFESFLHRQYAHARILSNRLYAVERYIEVAKRLSPDMLPNPT